METKTVNKRSKTPANGGERPKKDKGMFQDKEGRLIVRNLQFDIKQKHLKQDFTKFGNILDVSVPLNSENNLNKGFGFIEFKTRDEARKAIESLNGKNYKGRMIAVDFAMSKRQYNRKIDDIIEKNPIKNKKKLKENKEKAKKDDDADSWSGDETPEEEKPQKSKRDFSKDKKETEDDASSDKKEKKRTVKNRKKYENDVKEGLTLFVRNIDYSTTETELREFFEDFGKVYFVRLVKSRDNPEAHKGSAFVKFVDPEPVEKLAKISDDYWSKEKHTTSKTILNDLETQLEFKGRRLVMFKAESKDDRQKSKDKQEVKVDKRNIDYVKVGLITTSDFVNGPVSEPEMEVRIRLWKDKQDGIKKNPNLFVSKTRMCIRNLDRRMDEKNLAQFCTAFIQNWKDSLSVKDKKAANQKKLVHQYKILKDKEKTDSEGVPKSSGIGFIEVEDPDLAIYFINNMNNFVMNEKKPKGLILDFALEDHRKLLKRKQKLESLKKKQREAKAEKDKEEAKLKKRDKKEKVKTKKPAQDENKVTIDDIEDIEKLRELMKATNSRGKRNRIKRKIQRLNGEAPTEPRNTDHKQEKAKDSVPEKSEKVSKKDKKDKKDKKKKIEEEAEEEDNLSEGDLQGQGSGIELSKVTKSLLKKKAKTEDQIMEDEIKADMKRKKRKRKQLKEEDELDDVMKSFEERINKRLKTIEEAGDEVHNSDEGFEDVEIEQD